MVKAALIGFGNVGRELLLKLPDTGLGVTVASISSSRGSVVLSSNEDFSEAVKLAREGRKLDEHPHFREGMDPVEATVSSGAELALITLPPSYETGQPNLTIYNCLLADKVSIVTADKTVLAVDGRSLFKRADESCAYLGYRATVAAGTPAIDVSRGLRGRGVESIRAVLNATTNYILGLVEKGLSYDEAVGEAVKAKLAEPDPRVDTHGWDPAAKLVILSYALGVEAYIEWVERVPLETVSEELVRSSIQEGRRLKYVAYADYERRVFRVAPEVVGAGDPLSTAAGETNVIVFRVEGQEIVLKGPAGPAWRTAKVMVTDILEYIEWKRTREKCGS